MKERKHISIKIAEHAFNLESPPESVQTIKTIEDNFNRMWARWCENYPERTKQEVLAIVAFQYARHYYKLQQIVSENEEAITDFEKRLDEILLNVE